MSELKIYVDHDENLIVYWCVGYEFVREYIPLWA